MPNNIIQEKYIKILSQNLKNAVKFFFNLTNEVNYVHENKLVSKNHVMSLVIQKIFFK